MFGRFVHAFCAPEPSGGRHHFCHSHARFDHGPGGGGGGGFGPAFGVRRPLRFLAHKLQLDDDQVAELARILRDLKTERAQGEVERQRSLGALAKSIDAEAFDDAKAQGAIDRRLAGAKRVEDQVLEALRAIHAVLQPEQRGRLAYLIRTGSLLI